MSNRYESARDWIRESIRRKESELEHRVDEAARNVTQSGFSEHAYGAAVRIVTKLRETIGTERAILDALDGVERSDAKTRPAQEAAQQASFDAMAKERRAHEFSQRFLLALSMVDMAVEQGGAASDEYVATLRAALANPDSDTVTQLRANRALERHQEITKTKKAI